MDSFFRSLQSWCVAHRHDVIQFFHVIYAFIVLLIIRGIWLTFTHQPGFGITSTFGLLSGKVAIPVFLVIVYPGILGRFKIKHPLITIGILFRRYTGILSFLLVLQHVLMVYLLPTLAYKMPFFPIPTFIIAAEVAFLLLFLMFITSNDQSVKLMKKNWKLLHKSIYIVLWLIFVHVALQEVGGFALVMGGTATLEVISLMYDALTKKPAVATTPVPPPLKQA